MGGTILVIENIIYCKGIVYFAFSSSNNQKDLFQKTYFNIHSEKTTPHVKRQYDTHSL